MERSMQSMCNLSEGIREEGFAEGKLEGIEEGREEGREEGLFIAAKKMIEKGMSIDIVAESLEIPKEAIEKYLKEE